MILVDTSVWVDHLRTGDRVLGQLLDRLGIGYVDAHLLAAVRLTAGAKLWTRDRRFQAAATQLGLAMAPQP